MRGTLPFAVFALFLAGSTIHERVYLFPEPIDALSVGVERGAIALEVRARTDGGWIPWKSLAIEEEFDPLLRESNLVIFPKSVAVVHLRGGTQRYSLHPIRVARGPVRYEVAARDAVPRPKILSRRAWGADELLLVTGDRTSRSDVERTTDNGQGNGEIPERIRECEEWQRNFPQEFKRARRVTQTSDGKMLRWPQEYSPRVSLLVVHHTAIQVTGDERPSVERVRALYAYHAQNRGWGDIGYHYLLDEEGQIYEGRAGGDYVVGGHVYCSNVGTIGIALLGNFEVEQPTQVQMQSLQWLLDTLARQYSIDLEQQVTFHGKRLQAIVGHREIVSTDCPGYYVWETLNQVRRHVQASDLTASIRFPQPIVRKSLPKERVTTHAKTSVETRGGNDRLVRLRRKIRRYERTGTSRRTPPAWQTPGTRAPAARLQGPTPARGSPSVASETARIRIRLTKEEGGMERCEHVDLPSLRTRYRGTIECRVIASELMLIHELPLEEYLWGLLEEPDTEPFEKQRAFAIAARTYAAYYLDRAHRKFPGMPYDGSDDPAEFQGYGGLAFEGQNPKWVKAVKSTESQVLTVNGEVVRAAYFHSDDGRTRAPEEAGWRDFPFAEVFQSKPDPWCTGFPLSGHGVGMSGCGAEGQATEGRTAEEILEYYYPGTRLKPFRSLESPRSTTSPVVRVLVQRGEIFSHCRFSLEDPAAGQGTALEGTCAR